MVPGPPHMAVSSTVALSALSMALAAMIQGPWTHDAGTKVPNWTKPRAMTACCDRVTPSGRWCFPDLSGVVAGQGLGMKPQRPHVAHRRPALLPREEGRPMTSSPATMRAVRLSAPGPVGNLRLTTLPLPPERDGWVRIRVEAFGLNRSELKLRLGLSVGVSFPRVPGIEAAGTVDAAPAGSGLAAGQKVVAMMGDMGRTYDGGYAEYTSVPLSQVI